jgi:hypothetical protein
MTTNLFSPLSFDAIFGSGIRDPGSGMGKNQDPGSGINIPDPQHCCRNTDVYLNYFNTIKWREASANGDGEIYGD